MTALIHEEEVKGSGAAAILVTPDEKILLQLRDDKPGIWFPGLWGLFGGANEPGETMEEALGRELEEELGFRPQTLEYMCNLVFDLGSFEDGYRRRVFFIAPVTEAQCNTSFLGEGREKRLFSAEEIQSSGQFADIVPYDAFAIMLYLKRDVVRACRNIP
ncbi:MAG: NUDIX domain-containing protein [Kiloniellales bacterium]|nr:NUDIX domain-containing protein [Kiloniellales bacterium]